MTNTLTTTAYIQIKNLIFNGQVKPGEKLKGEFLKSQLNLGLSPIREALSKLSGTGLVDFNAKIGFSVATIERVKVYDIFETFARLENLLLSDALQKGDDAWESNILASLYRLSKFEVVKTPYNEWFERNEDFHNTLISGSNLNYLLELRNQCLQLKNWYLNLSYIGVDDLSILTNHNEHKRLADLAILRDKSVLNKLYSHNTNNIEACIVKLRSKNYINL